MSLLHDEQGKPSSSRRGLVAVLLWVVIMVTGEALAWWVLSDNSTQIILSLIVAFGGGAYAPKALGYARGSMNFAERWRGSNGSKTHNMHVPEWGEADEPG